MFGDSFFSLLSLMMSTVRFGHRSKSSNSLSPLNDKARISNFYDHGASLKVISLFYLSSRTIILLVFENAPFSIF